MGPNPLKPPPDPENPRWEHLSSNVGAQYFWIDRIFMWEADPTSFAFQLFHTSRPGALDTSLVSTDNINNPRTMNAVYEHPADSPTHGRGLPCARHAPLSRRGVELLPADLAHNTERLARFRREAQLLAALNHTNVATIHGLEETPEMITSR